MNRYSQALFIAAVLFFISFSGYSLIKKNEQAVFKSWVDVEAHLLRRADLIPDLFEFVNNYAPKERDILNDVINARAKTAMTQFSARDLDDPKAMAVFVEAQNELFSVLANLKNVVERYPDLKENQNFRDVWKRIEGTENRINVSCLQYNKTIETFNQSIRTFPYNVTNTLFLHHGDKQQLDLQPSIK